MIGHAMGFNLEDYETVAERLNRLHTDYLNARVITSLIHIERNKEGMPIQYVCKAEIWIGDILKATGWAEEIVGSSPVNRTSALENCESSAIGRAAANMNYQGKDPKKTRPSRTEMAKVVQMVKPEVQAVKDANPLNWGNDIPLPPEPLDDPFGDWNTWTPSDNPPEPKAVINSTNMPATPKQLGFIRKLCSEKALDAYEYATKELGYKVESLNQLSRANASQLIESLK